MYGRGIFLLGVNDKAWRTSGPGALRRDCRRMGTLHPEALENGDPAITAILEEPTYKLPTVLPNGSYRDNR